VHNFIQIAKDLNKIPLHYLRAENVDVHLYNFFSICCYIALAAIVNFIMGSPKIAWNEQVFAHQKLYRK